MKKLKSWKKLSKKQKDNMYANVGLGMMIIALVVIAAMVIGNFILKNRQYYYGIDNFTGHSNYCYKTDSGALYCKIDTKVNWFYEESKHE